MRTPLGPASANSWPAGGAFGSPTKLVPSESESQGAISNEEVHRNAALVLQALEIESPPAAEPDASSGVDTLLIRRLASDVQRGSDVVAAWGEVELLRGELRRKDDELATALEALAAAQQYGESPGALQRHSETAGQQLARFLKDQLAMRDDQLAATQAEAATLREQLGASERRAAELEAALQAARAAAEEQAEAANYARLEMEEARREAAAQVEQLRSELWAAEARANLAAYGTPEASSGWQAPEGSISLQQQPGTSYHSAGDGGSAGGPAAGEEPDVFSSPMLTALQREGRASSSPEPQPGSQAFQFATAHGTSGTAAAAAEEPADDGASSGVESEAAEVAEAAVVARTLTRASVLQKDREVLREQVRDLSQELRELKGRQASLSQNMQAAADSSDGGSGTPAAASAPQLLPQQRRRLRTPPRGQAASSDDGDAALVEQCRLHAVEERHMRSELDMLNRKCERANEMLLKANHAMKVLHYKLQKERKAVGRLQEEKCGLQAQLLAGGGGGDHVAQLAALLGELAAGRARIEGLLEEKATLAAKLEAVASGTAGRGSREQREAAAAAVAALQQQQEAAAAAMREDLAAERARSATVAEERVALEGRLQEALARLSAAEQISGHLEQMNAYLQEERLHCQQLASALGREQQGSESRAAENARLAAIAQTSTEEVMAAREAAQAERSRAEGLAHDNAELQGKVEALQETLGRLEKADDVLLRLTEDKAALQLQVHDAQAAAVAARAAAEEAGCRAGDAEAAAAELRNQLEASLNQQDVAHAAVEGAADQLQALTDSHEGLERQLASALADVAAAQAEAAERGQVAQQLERRCAALDAELQQAAQQHHAMLAQLQQAQAQLSAAAHEVKAMRAEAMAAAQQAAEAQQQLSQQAAEAQQQLEVVGEEQRELAAQLAGMQEENASLKDNLKALQAECEAVRALGSSMDHTNQALVDGMCDMSGLVDALQALQARNRLLQGDLDTLKSKYTDLHRSSEAQARSLKASQQELGGAKDELSVLQAAQAELQQECGRLQAELAAAREQLAAAREQLAAAREQRDTAAQSHQAAERQCGSLQERLAAAAAGQAEAQRSAQVAEERRQEATAAASQLREKLGEVERQLAAATGEKAEWGAQRSELQGQLAALQKAQSISDGKLVLARQREAQFKEASKQLKVLQQELAAFADEGHAHRQKWEQAEQRCEALEARCLELEGRGQELEQQLAEAQDARKVATGAQAELQQQLAEARLSVAQLEQQQGMFQSVQQRLSELETEQHTSSEWFDALTAELADKGDLLAALQLQLQAAEAAAAESSAAAAAAQRKAVEMEVARTSAVVAHTEAASSLQQTRQQLEECSAQLEAAEATASKTTALLAEAQAGWEGTEAVAAEAQQRAAQARQECNVLQQQLAGAQASAAATQVEQQQRIEQLHRGLFVMAAVHATTVREQHAAASAAAEHHAEVLANSEAQHAAALLSASEQHSAAQQLLEAVVQVAEGEHQERVAGLQRSVEELSAQLAAAASQHAAATERCTALEGELAAAAEAAAHLEQQLGEAKAAHTAAAAARDAAERRHEEVAADAAAHARHADMLEQQCGVLREQLAFLHEQQQSDSDEVAALKAALAASTADGDALHQQLSTAQAAVADSAAALQRLQAELQAAEGAQHAALERQAELERQVAAGEAALQASQAAAEEARQEADEAEGQANHLRQQLEAEEERRRAAEAALDAAALEREGLLAKAQVHDMLDSLSGRLQDQMQLLQRLEGSSSAQVASGGGEAPEALAARRELLAQALEQLQALKAENQELWRRLEEHLPSAGDADDSRPNRYLAHLEGEREQLAVQLAAQQAEHAAEAKASAGRLAAAQTAIGKLQAVVHRLSAAGGGGSAAEVLPLLPAAASPGLPLPAATAQHSGLSSASEAEAWQAEKRLLKAICKLALAVTMDQVGGRQEAASLAHELAPLMAAHATALQQLGLHKVWASLHKLAVSGGGAGGQGGSSVSQAQAQPERFQPAVADTEPRAAEEAWAMQQRVAVYKTKCRELKATVVAMEGAAARWQAQAGEVEQGLALLRFRLADLLAEVKWCLEDYSDASDAGVSEDAPSSHQLNMLVEELSRGLRRILRKYRTLSAHLHKGDTDQRQQHQQAHPQSWRSSSSGGGQQEASSSAAGASGSWGIGAGRQGGGGGGGASTSEAMAEAGRKAASIAAKLDRLLTPGTRAAVHGGGMSGGVGGLSRFAAEAAAGNGEEHDAGEREGGGGGAWQPQGPLSKELFWGLAGDPSDDVPLRQRYAAANSGGLGL